MAGERVMIRWRNDHNASWQDEIQQEVNGKMDFLYVAIPQIYRTRQYEISFTENRPFVLISMEEEVEVLGY